MVGSNVYLELSVHAMNDSTWNSQRTADRGDLLQGRHFLGFGLKQTH